MSIPKVSSTELQQNVGRYQDMVQRTLVAITKYGRDPAIMMSAALFEVIAKGRVARKIEDADEETLDEISRAEVAPKHAHLDSLFQRLDAVTSPKPEIGLVLSKLSPAIRTRPSTGDHTTSGASSRRRGLRCRDGPG